MLPRIVEGTEGGRAGGAAAKLRTHAEMWRLRASTWVLLPALRPLVALSAMQVSGQYLADVYVVLGVFVLDAGVS